MGKPKKTAARTGAGTIPKVTLDMPLTPEKIKAIHGCLAKGALKITVSKVNLASGKIGEAWLYD